MPPHICPDCDQCLDDDALVWPIPDIAEKVLPGEAMPAGECPDCGALINTTDILHLKNSPIPTIGDELDENFE